MNFINKVFSWAHPSPWHLNWSVWNDHQDMAMSSLLALAVVWFVKLNLGCQEMGAWQLKLPYILRGVWSQDSRFDVQWHLLGSILFVILSWVSPCVMVADNDERGVLYNGIMGGKLKDIWLLYFSFFTGHVLHAGYEDYDSDNNNHTHYGGCEGGSKEAVRRLHHLTWWHHATLMSRQSSPACWLNWFHNHKPQAAVIFYDGIT